MSFILDALKKSENDRQRQSGPALFEVRVAPPRSKLPLLAIAIVVLLLVNLGVVGWLMLRKPAAAAVPPPQIAGTPAAQAGAPPPVPGTQATAPLASPAGVQPPPSSAAPPAYGAAAPAPNAYPQSAQNSYPSANPGGDAGAGAPDPMRADEAPPAQGLNPDDYEPARQPPPPGTGEGRVVRSTSSGLPTYEEVSANASIPPVHMDLHSYAPDPGKRFVLINMKRLYEGQALPEGVKVESITSDAAILSYNGTKFVLNSD